MSLADLMDAIPASAARPEGCHDGLTSRAPAADASCPPSAALRSAPPRWSGSQAQWLWLFRAGGGGRRVEWVGKEEGPGHASLPASCCGYYRACGAGLTAAPASLALGLRARVPPLP